jgi:type IV secretion system protein VirB10
MRFATVLLLAVGSALAQSSAPAAAPAAAPTAAPAAAPVEPAKASAVTLASGTKVPLSLKQTISTKSAKEGDAVYCETVFPVVQDGHIVIPAGTYIQGKISHVQRAGHVKGRAEVLMHFTTMIYPNGYTVMLPGSVDNVPGAGKTSMKGPEGTVRQDSQTAEKVGTIAGPATTGAIIGGIAGGGKGAAIGAASGGALGTAIALLTRGNDVVLENGTSIEMVLGRAVDLDPSRIPPQQTQMVVRQ